MRRYATFVLMLLFCGIVLSPIGKAQSGPHSTHTGYYYPATDVADGIDRGYHRIGGSAMYVQQGPSHTGFGGHFMSPDAQVNDSHTGQAGWYNFNPDINVYHNGMDVMAPHGTYVYAAADGYIDQVSPGGWDVTGSTHNIGLVIRSTSPTAGAFKTVYGHIEESTCMYCAPNQLNAQVYKGQYLGSVGTYGGAEHLHFGIWVGTGSIPLSSTLGLGRNAISYWPDRKGWVDPVQFIETTCPSGAAQSCFDGADSALAFYDMKQGMIAKFDKALTPYPNDLRWVWDDIQGHSNHYRSWFSKTVGGVTTWYEAEVGVDKTNKLVRWWGYYDVNSNWSGWKSVVVFP